MLFFTGQSLYTTLALQNCLNMGINLISDYVLLEHEKDLSVNENLIQRLGLVQLFLQIF